MTTIARHSPVEQLLGHVTDGRSDAAYRLVDDLLASGWDVERLVVELLVVVQRRVGQQWQSGDWTVAQEHQITAVIDDLLGALGRRVSAPRSHGTVALVCAEGEWHVTPARMAVLLLRYHGWATSFLGGSTPAEHLRRSLELARPSFVAISCTVPLSLLGASRVAGVARDLGIPTLAGGAAFGPDATRAERLGIDGWAPDVGTASLLLQRWLDRPPTRPPARPHARALDDAEQRTLERYRSSIVERAIAPLANAIPPVVIHEAQSLARLRRDLDDLLRMAHLAVLCGDDGLFSDFVAWLVTVHPARELPHAAVRSTIEVLHELAAPLDDGTPEVLGRWLRVRAAATV